MKSPTLRYTLLTFLIVFLWMCFLLKGMTIGDLDDWDHLLTVDQHTLGEILRYLLTPWSTAASWHARADLYSQILHERVFHSFLFKTGIVLWGFQPFLHYALQKAIFFSITTGLYFFLSYRLLRSFLWSSVLTFFFVMLPVNYMHLFWLCDGIVVAHTFILLGVVCYLSLTRYSIDTPPSLKTTALVSIALYYFSLFALRTKSPGLILPLTLLTVFLFNFNPIRKKRFFLVALALSLALFAIIPIKSFALEKKVEGIKSSSKIQFNIDQVRRMVLRNDHNEYEPEKTTAFFSLKSDMPVSIARNLGFFLLWLIIASILWNYRKRLLFSPILSSDTKVLLRIAIVWMSFEIFFMGFFDTEPRYFSGTMIPITWLASYSLKTALDSLKGIFHKIFTYLLVIVTAYTSLGSHLSHNFFLRMRFSTRYEQVSKAAEIIYQTELKDQNPNPYNLGRFYCLYCDLSQYQGPRLESWLYYSDIGLAHWQASGGDINNFSVQAHQGKPYYISYDSQKFVQDPNVQLVAQIPPCSKQDIFCTFLMKIKKKKPSNIFVYRHSGVPPLSP